jgi:hypothetical protein
MDSADKLHAVLEKVDPGHKLHVVQDVDRSKPQNNKKTRIAAWKELIAIRDPRTAAEAGFGAFHDALDYLSHWFGRTVHTEPTIPSEDEATEWMSEALAIKTVDEAMTARLSMIREEIFEAITLIYKAEGADDPENISGAIEVPKLDKKFCKEGAGLNAPTVDWEYLKEQLSEEEWAECVDTEVIPEHVEETPNRLKLADFLQANPKHAKLVRKAMKQGTPKTPKFQIRDIDEDVES